MSISIKRVLLAFIVGVAVAPPMTLAARVILGMPPWEPLSYFLACFLAGLLGALVGAMGARNRVWLEGRVRSRTAELARANELLREEIEHSKLMDEQLRQSQRLEAIGRLAGGVAHDMNNVLAGIMSVASSMELEIEDGEGEVSREDVADILDACKRGRDLTASLLGFARKGELQRQPMSLSRAVKDVERLIGRVAPKDVNVRLDLEDGLPQILGDPSLIRNVFMNLCINAIDAMEGKGELLVRVRASSPGDEIGSGGRESSVRLDFIDDGAGIPEEILDKIFDPFFTTKPEGTGTGLGLSRAYGTIRDHGGEIEVNSRVGEGTTVSIFLPALLAHEQNFSVRSSAPPGPMVERKRILLVDDEGIMRTAGKRLLGKLGYDVVVARDGIEGLEEFDRSKEGFDAIVLDMLMPRMGGEEAFEHLRNRDSKIPILICSGYSSNDATSRLLDRRRVGFVPKPFSAGLMSEQLARIIGEV